MHKCMVACNIAKAKLKRPYPRTSTSPHPKVQMSKYAQNVLTSTFVAAGCDSIASLLSNVFKALRRSAATQPFESTRRLRRVARRRHTDVLACRKRAETYLVGANFPALFFPISLT